MKEYGGYLPIELPKNNEYYLSEQNKKVASYNCGRTAAYVALKDFSPRKIYLPHYNCETCLDPITDLNIDYEFYFLNEDIIQIILPILNRG